MKHIDCLDSEEMQNISEGKFLFIIIRIRCEQINIRTIILQLLVTDCDTSVLMELTCLHKLELLYT